MVLVLTGFMSRSSPNHHVYDHVGSKKSAHKRHARASLA